MNDNPLTEFLSRIGKTSIVWVKGNVGSGKSTYLRKAVEHLKPKFRCDRPCYVFEPKGVELDNFNNNFITYLKPRNKDLVATVEDKVDALFNTDFKGILCVIIDEFPIGQEMEISMCMQSRYNGIKYIISSDALPSYDFNKFGMSYDYFDLDR